LVRCWLPEAAQSKKYYQDQLRHVLPHMVCLSKLREPDYERFGPALLRCRPGSKMGLLSL